jgi:hypothetical protein
MTNFVEGRRTSVTDETASFDDYVTGLIDRCGVTRGGRPGPR